MAKTSINWTDRVWNPIRGCSKVSDGCRNCYAERFASRFSGPGLPYEGLIRDGHWANAARFVTEMLAAPLHWKQPCRVFVNSMSDLFHESVSDEQIALVFAVMAHCDRHTFQILTKRPERAAHLLCRIENNRFSRHGKYAGERLPDCYWLGERCWQIVQSRYDAGRVHSWNYPLPNVHIGASIENQAAAEERIPLLLECPAAVHWVSCEPLLSQITMNLDWLSPFVDVTPSLERTPRLDWVVCGGESGPNARPMHPDWVRSLRDQCREAGVPFHFKQWGEWMPGGFYEGFTVPDCMGSAMNNPKNQHYFEPPLGKAWRVGAMRSGNLLDGVRYEMRPGDKWQ